MSDHKSPLVCSLAPSPGPRPFPSGPRRPQLPPNPPPFGSEEFLYVHLRGVCTCASEMVVCQIYCYPAPGLETWL